MSGLVGFLVGLPIAFLGGCAFAWLAIQVEKRLWK